MTHGLAVNWFWESTWKVIRREMAVKMTGDAQKRNRLLKKRTSPEETALDDLLAKSRLELRSGWSHTYPGVRATSVATTKRFASRRRAIEDKSQFGKNVDRLLNRAPNESL
jgi:hypothetical protein